MDDFEFKPLTEGLGFHKKAQRLKAEAQQSSLTESVFSQPLPQVPEALLESESPSTQTLRSSFGESSLFEESQPLSPLFSNPSNSTPADRAASASISDLMASLPPSLDFEAPPVETPVLQQKRPADENLFAPLAKTKVEDLVDADQTVRKTAHPQRQLSQHLTSPVSPVTTKSLPKSADVAPGVKKSMDASLEKAFPKRDLATRTQTEKDQNQEAAKAYAQLEPVSQGIMASFLDGVVVAGISVICMVILSFAIQIDLMRLLFDPRTSTTAILQLAVLFVGVTQIYMLAARGLFGTSLGDWAFDLQLGTPQQQYSIKYPVLVLWRSLVVTMTGLFVLPVLSLLFKRDLLMYATGLQLFKRKVR